MDIELLWAIGSPVAMLLGALIAVVVTWRQHYTQCCPKTAYYYMIPKICTCNCKRCKKECRG